MKSHTILKSFPALLYAALQMPAPSARRALHYRKNLEALKHMPPGLIENQHTVFWDGVHYGYCPLFHRDFPASKNFCGPAAVYNACLLLGLPAGPVRLAALLRHFERKGIALRGYAGTAPSALCRYFRELGCRTETLFGDDALRPEAFGKEYRIFLATVLKDRNRITKGLHSVCISADACGFRIHNASCGHVTVFPTLPDAIRNAGHDGSRRPPCSLPVSVTAIAGAARKKR